ncbi:hypothetical protein [Sphingomonas oryzagri]
MATAGQAAETPTLVVPDFGQIVDVAGAKMRPDPEAHYRIVFGVTKAAAKPDQPTPSLDRVARFVNLLDHYSVPKDIRLQ